MNKKFDICVIGTGPAGLITALEYNRLNPNKSILLVEYGHTTQKKKNSLDDSINIINPAHHHEPYECTNKGFGGTSLTWGGRCVMYDEIDFIKRPSVNEDCTWDLQLFEEVKRYTNIAADYFECGKAIFNLKHIPEFQNKRIAEGFSEGPITDSYIERWSMPTRFGSRYRETVRLSNNIVTLEGYEARQFDDPDNNGHIKSLALRHVTTGEYRKVEANTFIIAAGTQESTRLLLRNKQLFKLLKKVPDSLGRYYQCHLFGKIASVSFTGDPKKTEYGFLRNKDGSYIRRRFQFSTDYLLKNDLLNTAIWLDNPLYYDPAHKNGVMSLMYLAMLTPVIGKRLAPPAIAQSITKGQSKGVLKHIFNIIKDFPKSITIPANIFFKRYLIKRKLPGVFLYNHDNTYALNFHSEQIPSKENRMELASDNETLDIHYEISDADINSLITLHETLDFTLRKKNCGELIYWFKKEELFSEIKKMSKDGIHQIGTTRIAESPKDGVVDRNLKVFGTNNIYVCSSSVFPTSGQANPTFFLGAFAARLAKHLS